ncbi:MAG: PspC domain-containing protein [Mycoplasmatales bacterium]
MSGKKLYRDLNNKMVGGVCSGLAEYFEIDPTIIRLAIVFLIPMTFSTVLIAYIAALIIIPIKEG